MCDSRVHEDSSISFGLALSSMDKAGCWVFVERVASEEVNVSS